MRLGQNLLVLIKKTRVPQAETTRKEPFLLCFYVVCRSGHRNLGKWGPEMVSTVSKHHFTSVLQCYKMLPKLQTKRGGGGGGGEECMVRAQIGHAWRLKKLLL